MKKVYICSPCRGDYTNNIQRAKEYSRTAAMQGCIPITPHIYLTQFMDDAVPAERELALSFGRELVLLCDELWAFGLDKPTEGMAAEIELAQQAGIPVVNGFRAISELGHDADRRVPSFAAAAVSAATVIAAALEELSQPKEQPAKIGSVTIHIPGFTAMALCNEHLNRPPVSVELDGRIILDLAAKLRENPGDSFEIGGDGHE